MAQFLDKDPYSYDKERQAFVNELRLFHTRLGTPLYRLPTIAGKELDLYLLYKKVIALGGLAKIYDDYQWDDILLAFNLPPSCCHAAFALRSFYVKYLEAYEKIHHQGEDSAEVMAAHKSNVPTGQMQGNRHISDKLRANVGLSTSKPRITDYDKIIQSLKCGLPNEVDFAINVCTLLSNEGKHVIHLERAPHLIDLLLAHVGVFFEGPGSLRMLYEEDWVATTDRNFVKYWYDTVEDKDVREVIGPEPFKPKGDMDYKEGELFCGRTQGISDVEKQRIMQISIILRNLSFEKHNRRVMAAHRTLYRFLLLCVHNSDSALKQIGMDALSNLAADFILDPIDYRSTQLMFHTIDKGVIDPDRVVVLRAMEVLQKLSKVQTNLETLKMCLEERVYKAIVQMLIVHDVQLLLGALEVLLALSQTGEIICTKIAKVDKSIDILVCLITLDAQSLGAEAFVGIKIVDHAPHGIHHPVVTMARYQGRALSQAPPPSQGPPPPMPVPRPNTPHHDRLAATPPPPHPAPLPQQQNVTAPSSAASRAAESETFAKEWLHATFEPNHQAAVSRIDLYSDYLAACSKFTSGSILNSNTFGACLRNAYPNIGFRQVGENNASQYHITGIQKRAVPLPMRWHPKQQAPPQVNYTMQVGNSQNTASNIIASLARRHSPTGNSAASPPPVRNPYQMNTAQQSMVKSTTQPMVNQMSTQQQFPHRQQLMMQQSQGQAVLPGRPPPPAPSPNLVGGLANPIQPHQTNYIPQTVLQRPPPSHMPSPHSPIASPKSPRSRSKSPKPCGSNPGTPQPSPALPPQSISPAPSPMAQQQQRGEMSPRSDITNDSSARSSPATVIISGVLPQEKCQPPSQASSNLPEGEVRIQKVPNLHAQLLQQAAMKAQQDLGNPLPLQVQQQQAIAIEVQPGAPSPDNGLALNPLPNPLGLQQQMQQAMEAAASASAVPVPSPTNGPYLSTTTTQYVAIQPKPSSVPVPSSSQPQQLPNQPVQQPPLQVNAMSPQQNPMQLLVINRPQQPGNIQQPVANQVQPQQALPNQFPRLATHVPIHNTSQANTDSPLIKRLLQTGTAVQPPVRVSPQVSPQQQMVQPSQTVPMPNNNQWAGPNQTMPQVLPTQGINHAGPVQTTQQQPVQQLQQNVVGFTNNNNANMAPQPNMVPNHIQNAVMHRPFTPPPSVPTVNEQLQQHREQQRQMQQHHPTLPQQAIPSSQPCNNLNGNQHGGVESKKMNGPTSTPALLSPSARNGPRVAESKEMPKCNGTSENYNSVLDNSVEKMEVDPIKKAAIKPVESLLKQHLVNGYASDSDMPIKNDIVTVNRVEEPSSGILEAALSIAGIEPDSDSRTSSGTSTPSDKLLASAKDNNGPINHLLNGEILCDRNKTVGETNLNQGTSNGIATMIISNNGTSGVAQDPNIPRQQHMMMTGGKQPLNQLILCSRDIRDNLPSSLHILPNNYNNNNQQAGTVVASATGMPQGSTSNTSGSVQLVAQSIAQQQAVKQQPVQHTTAVSRNNTVQVQGALITVQQPPQQQNSRRPVTLQLQQPNSNVQQLVVTTQHPQQQQQTLIVRPVQPQTGQQQTMNIQVQNPNGQTQQQVIRLPVSIQGSQPQIVSMQRPIQAGAQTQQQSMFIVNMPAPNRTASTMPAPSSVTPVKSLKRPSDSKDSTKVNNTVDGSSSSSSSSHHHKEKKEKKSKHHSSSKKKRKSSSSSSSHQSSCKKSQSSEQPKSTPMICMCEWRGCRRSFSTPKALHVHTSTVHVMGRNYRMMCEWEGCDHIQRQKWSCVSHILDKHCSQQALKAAMEKRAKKALNSPANDVVSGPTQPPVVYNAHNAYHAIRRSLNSPSLKDLLRNTNKQSLSFGVGETEGPVTKSIRLTASLVLKNLASRSEEARRIIRKHESHLARLAISQAEASTTLAKCILELNRRT